MGIMDRTATFGFATPPMGSSSIWATGSHGAGRRPGQRGIGVADVPASWQRLHDQHALVLNRATAEIRMANPFSAIPSAYRIKAASRWWYANCAWDAVGVSALCTLTGSASLRTSCPDCGETISLRVEAYKPDETSLLLHCLVPARRWWDDIVYTCTTMNLFRSEEHIERWLGGREPGQTIPVTQAWPRLGSRFVGRPARP